MFGLGLLGPAVDEGLHFVELVDPDDAAGVLAVAAGFAPEAGRPARVALRSVGEVQDLVGVIPGERDFGGADQVEVIGLNAVDLVGVRAEEAGAGHYFRADQHRRDHQGEPVVGRQSDRQLQQTQLQQRAAAGQEVEPRPRHLGAALHVDKSERLTEFQMVFRIVDRRGLADDVEHHKVVFTAGRYTVDDQIRNRQMRRGEHPLGLGLTRLDLLDLGGEVLGPLE